MKQIKVAEQYDHIRLDKFLKKVYPFLKQGEIEKWCRKGLVKLSGTSIKQAGFRVQSGQVFTIPDIHRPVEELKKQKVNLSMADVKYIRSLIIAQHEDFWVLNKPSGLAIQGGTKTHRYVDCLLLGLKENEQQDPKIVHRLDKDTSGILLIAKNYQAARFLATGFKEKLIKKTYHALVVGCPEKKAGFIDAPLYKRPSKAGEKIVVDFENGSSAQTYYEIEDTLDSNLSLIRLEPVTGRTHQLRVHCAYMGCPILGDGKYGGQKAHPFCRRTRLMLHASRLELQDKNNRKQVYTCPFNECFSEISIIN